jgi:hypothetical protein
MNDNQVAPVGGREVELSRECPACKRITGRLYRLVPTARQRYEARQRCDLCGHRWNSVLTSEGPELGLPRGISQARGSGTG